MATFDSAITQPIRRDVWTGSDSVVDASQIVQAVNFSEGQAANLRLQWGITDDAALDNLTYGLTHQDLYSLERQQAGAINFGMPYVIKFDRDNLVTLKNEGLRAFANANLTHARELQGAFGFNIPPGPNVVYLLTLMHNFSPSVSKAIYATYARNASDYNPQTTSFALTGASFSLDEILKELGVSLHLNTQIDETIGVNSEHIKRSESIRRSRIEQTLNLIHTQLQNVDGVFFDFAELAASNIFRAINPSSETRKGFIDYWAQYRESGLASLGTLGKFDTDFSVFVGMLYDSSPTADELSLLARECNLNDAQIKKTIEFLMYRIESVLPVTISLLDTAKKTRRIERIADAFALESEDLILFTTNPEIQGNTMARIAQRFSQLPYLIGDSITSVAVRRWFSKQSGGLFQDGPLDRLTDAMTETLMQLGHQSRVLSDIHYVDDTSILADTVPLKANSSKRSSRFMVGQIPALSVAYLLSEGSLYNFLTYPNKVNAKLLDYRLKRAKQEEARFDFEM